MSKEQWKFTRAVVRNWRQVGAVAPSSPFLVNAMVRPIDFARARRIVELGPGTGVITKALLKRMRPDCTLVVFEVGDEFCDALKQLGDKRLEVRNESAERIGTLPRPVDYVVSGLPLANLDPQVRRRIVIRARDILEQGGVFLQFQYLAASRGLIHRVFGNIETKYEARNVPPAFIFRCIRQRHDP